MPKKIPTFSADGRRLRGHSPESAAHLTALSFVAARRNRRGVILAIFFRDQDGGSPLRATMKPGQRYSFLGDSRMWQHQELDTGAAEFQTVVLKCCCPLDVAA